MIDTSDKIKCPKCGEYFEPGEAFRHQLKEQLAASLSKKHQNEIEIAKKKARQDAQADYLKGLKDKDNQINELKNRAEKAESEELKIRKEKRLLQEEKEKFEIEKERQLDVERENIKVRAVQEVQEKDKFKFAEYEKKISDMNKVIDELERKKGGSQQLQGEVLELDVENLLKESFPEDEIVPIGKGQQGGDIIQRVKGKSGKVAGIILWETKRASWQKTWIGKLKEDSRRVGATVSVLLSVNLPSEISDFKMIEGVAVCSYKQALSLATVLRRSVLHIAFAKQTAENKDENLEMLYEYLQSEAFRHRFEAFAEGIVSMEEDLDYERRAMERVWKKREVQIRKMKINAARMYGELQGVMGNALPDIRTLALPQGDEEGS